MGKSLYLINPAAETPGYFTAEAYGAGVLTPAATVGDLAVVTVAALVGTPPPASMSA